MPSPTPSWNLVRVYGTWRGMDGAAKAGNYRITIPVRITNAADDSIIPAGLFAAGALKTSGGASLDVLVPATDDPDNSVTGWQVVLEVMFADSTAEKYVIDVPVAARPIADGGNGVGVNLRTVVLSDTIPQQTAQYRVGVPGGLATLNSDGDVIDANGSPITGGSGGSSAVASVNGEVGAVTLTAAKVGAKPSTYTPAYSELTGKPSTFPPDAHTHSAASLTGVVKTINGASPNSAGDVSVATTGAPGIVTLDSFAGATDDDKLTAALSYAAAQTQIPAIHMPTNRKPTFTLTRTPFSGMKLVGGPGGNRNPELAGGKYITSQVQLNCGNGTSSWFVGAGAYYNIYVANLAFQGNGGSSATQFWHQPLSTAPGLYSCRFESLGFNMMRHVFGTPTAAAAMTQTEFVGHWTVNNAWNQQFTLAGSDNDLWGEGYVNIGTSQSAAQTGASGSFYMQFAGLSNTRVGYIYASGLNGWNCVRVTGNSDGLDFFGGVYEGYKGTPLTTLANPGNVLRLEGGSGSVHGGNFGQAMGNPPTGHNGTIEVTGGEWSFFGPNFYKGGTAETVPMIAHSGGRVVVIGARRRQAESWSNRPRYLSTGGAFYCPDGSMIPA